MPTGSYNYTITAGSAFRRGNVYYAGIQGTMRYDISTGAEDVALITLPIPVTGIVGSVTIFTNHIYHCAPMIKLKSGTANGVCQTMSPSLTANTLVFFLIIAKIG